MSASRKNCSCSVRVYDVSLHSLVDMNDSKLIIALTKGRILQETLPLLLTAGIEPLEDVTTSRKLLFETGEPGVQLLIMRGSDVPTYVRFGSADMGIAGKDLILEGGSEGFYEPLDLNIARCKMMTAVPIQSREISGRLRVATKFTNIAKQFYAERGQQVELIKLSGALELAPSLGLADAIVDIVDTGKTLKANGLVPQDKIADISSRVIVNKAAMKIKTALIQKVLTNLSEAVDIGVANPAER